MEEEGTRQDNLDEGQEAVGRFGEEPGAAPGGSSGTVHRNTPPLLRVEGRLCSRNSAGRPSGHFRDVVLPCSVTITSLPTLVGQDGAVERSAMSSLSALLCNY